jgi:signal transduction histidine kinase/DNA-binding response OmpR family regulator
MAKVLIVDDEKSIRNTVSEFLRLDGHEVQAAENADAADALMQAHSFDVVVTDIILPRVSGVTLLQRIKERAPDIQVIMMTGEPTVDTAVEAVRAGAYDYLSKPTGKRELLAVVGQAARVKALLDEQQRLKADNQRYQENLERMVGERTEALAARTRQLEAVREVAAEISREMNLRNVLSLITRRAMELVVGLSATVFLWDEEAQCLVPGAWHGYGEWRGDIRLRLGEGVAGTVAARRERLVLDDYPTSPYALPAILAHTTAGPVLAEPLLCRGAMVGVLVVDRTSGPKCFSPEDQEILTSFATHAAIAIENARLYDTALRRGLELEALLAATRSVMSGLDLQAILEQIASEAARISGCPHVKLLLVDPEAGVLRVAVLRGRSNAEGFPLPIGVGLSGRVAETGAPLYVADTQHDPRSALAAEDRAFGIRTYLGLPIKTPDTVLGVLTLNTTAPHEYTPAELAYLTSFADQAAVALDHARQHAAARARADDLETLREIEQAMMVRLDLPAVLEAIVAGASRLLASDFAQLVLWDEATGQLRFGAARGPSAECVKAQVFVLGRGINGVVAQQRQPMILNDYAASAYAIPECADIVATITVPICFGDRLLGVLHSHSKTPGIRYTAEDLRRLQMLAGQAAVAIENARLYQQTQEHAVALEGRVVARTAELAVANQELRTASQNKSAFLANMSHELRTPLNSILGFAQLLQEQTKEALSTKQTRFLTNIYTSGQHLLQLINDILDLSKVEAGKITLERVPLAVAEILEDLLVITRGLANKKGQTVQVEVAPDLPRLTADPVRFKQIFFNLVSNAVKFTPNGGTISVAARRICDFQFPISNLKGIGPKAQSQIPNQKSQIGDFLEIAVADTGAGIRAADLPKLFKEFTQLETTAAQAHEGTGLGLALTKRLVELHGGTITAASPGEGLGSTFTLRLPFGGPTGRAEE